MSSRGARTMNRLATLRLLPCLALATFAMWRPAYAATMDEKNSARLDALEKENATLRARVNRLEASKVAKIRPRPEVAEPDPAFAPMPRPQTANVLVDYVGKAVADPPVRPPPRFEISVSLFYLQPGAGDLEYGTLVSPSPIATPNWSNQS